MSLDASDSVEAVELVEASEEDSDVVSPQAENRLSTISAATKVAKILFFMTFDVPPYHCFRLWYQTSRRLLSERMPYRKGNFFIFGIIFSKSPTRFCGNYTRALQACAFAFMLCRILKIVLQ